MLELPQHRRTRRRRYSRWVYWRRRAVVSLTTLLVVAAVSFGVARATSPAPATVEPWGIAHVLTGTVPALMSPITGDGSPPSPPQPPFAVGHGMVTLIDHTRETPERGDVSAQSERVLVTAIRSPIGAIGPLPLVVFAHGWNSDPEVYETLLDTWAAAGYLVAAPTFPDSADTLPGTPVSDYPDQARDLMFVITAMLNGASGKVDPARIAVAGHSDGATDVALLALNPAYADPRIQAYLSFSGQIPNDVDGPWVAPTAGALMVAVGTDDEYGLFPEAYQMFESAHMAKVFVSATGGDHLDTFIGGSPVSVAMRMETLKFLAVALGNHGVASTQLAITLYPTGDPALAVNRPPPAGT